MTFMFLRAEKPLKSQLVRKFTLQTGALRMGRGAWVSTKLTWGGGGCLLVKE